MGFVRKATEKVDQVSEDVRSTATNFSETMKVASIAFAVVSIVAVAALTLAVIAIKRT